MLSKAERAAGTPIFQSKGWESRRIAIAARVLNQVERARRRKSTRLALANA